MVPSPSGLPPPGLSVYQDSSDGVTALLSLVVVNNPASLPLPIIAYEGRGYDRLLLGVSWLTAVGRSRAWWMPLDPELVAREGPGKCLLTEVSFYTDSPAGITSPVSVCGCLVLIRGLRSGVGVVSHEHEACDVSTCCWCRVEADVVVWSRVTLFQDWPAGVTGVFLALAGGIDSFRFRRMSVRGSRL